MLINMFFFSGISGQILVGSQRDDHNCVLDGGYEWCESLQQCIRQWETPCVKTSDCSLPCPPEPPCPMPYLPNMNECNMIADTDSCGCTTSCPHFDCRNIDCETDLDCRHDEFCRPRQLRIPMVNGRRNQVSSSECVSMSGINETCGGYTPPEFESRCLTGLECVNTRPMIADAPGICKEPCPRGVNRDENGNCISQVDITIPNNCMTWYDGCNTCQVRNGRADICTLMYCFVQNEPYCMNFHKNELGVNDICYRFCEDGSQSFINLRDNCPENTECRSTFNENSVSMISYDSCGSRSWTCQSVGH